LEFLVEVRICQDPPSDAGSLREAEQASSVQAAKEDRTGTANVKKQRVTDIDM
jgi:hypothetical protein